MKKFNKEQKSLTFAEKRNYEAQQTSFLSALINMKYDLCIQKPTKCATSSLPLFKIVHIKNDEFLFEVMKDTKEKMKQIYYEDLANGVSEKTASRRQTTYKVTYPLAYLIDLCKANGFNVDTVDVNRKGKAQQKWVVAIEFDGFVFDKETISKKGARLNKVFVERMGENVNSKTVVLKKFDTELMALLLSDLETI
ncbi:hypothetical protein EIN_391330 [Entamoeba invadens IP1]|uniref:Uncharacterized protein n=1 Tax=Entamoeba invadens IP1 TaxID=370355 RepID=A0A0A1U8R2_ENTIV|nr:hypothetical protein EIN_391330 [Entamoeba invadens IP1]ELP89478.1 hypothetical protein EIN_391330 [Entamoeba invadens IP1]|eukprot:XP_004256249.1 hypothetical protein EIN_391330 [Entamoeba invadens IP1]